MSEEQKKEQVNKGKNNKKTVMNVVLFIILAIAVVRFFVQYQGTKQAQIERESKASEIRKVIEAEKEKIESGNILSSAHQEGLQQVNDAQVSVENQVKEVISENTTSLFDAADDQTSILDDGGLQMNESTEDIGSK